jgi:hypothetical protein
MKTLALALALALPALAGAVDLNPLLRAAQEEWQAGDCPRLPDVPVQIRWVDRLPPGILAATETITAAGRPVFIIIWVLNDPYLWAKYDLPTIIRHEVGHTLGLPHTNSGLMAPNINPGRVEHPSATDLEMLCKLP